MTNAFIAEEAHNLPTTQKAVVNAIVLSGIDNEPNGMREIYMDNKYPVCPTPREVQYIGMRNSTE